MHSSGFDEAATETLTIEGVAGDRLWDLHPTSGDHPTSHDGWTAGRPNDHPRGIRGHVLAAIPSSEVGGHPTAN